MTALNELNGFLAGWEIDPLNAKSAFKSYEEYLASLPGVKLEFKARPGVSYSLRAKNESQKNRDLFVLVDVVDDDPENRWLSVCFYADMVTDPEDMGDLVPQGLFGEDAMCFNLDEDDAKISEYIASRIREAAKNAAK